MASMTDVQGLAKVQGGLWSIFQKQMNTPLKADHPERPTITLGWSLAHPRGILEHNSCFLMLWSADQGGIAINRGGFEATDCRSCRFPGRTFMRQKGRLVR